MNTINPTTFSFKFMHSREIQLMLIAVNRLDQSLLSADDRVTFGLLQDAFKSFALDPDISS